MSGAGHIFGPKGRIGIVLPANNSVLEPELWSRVPDGVACYTTRLLVRGDLTPEAVRTMERQVDRAVEELSATIVDAVVYADMVTTFIMEDGWNETKTREIAERAGVPCLSAWTALRDALGALGVRRFALGTPYPARIHDAAARYFRGIGFSLSDDATLDILATTDVPRVTPERLRSMVLGLDRDGADAVVLLATDLPTFASIDALEQATGLPVLTCNQSILWAALRAVGNEARLPGLGRLLTI